MDMDLNALKEIGRDAELSELLDHLMEKVELQAAFLSDPQNEGGGKYRILTLIAAADQDPLPHGALALASKLGKQSPTLRSRIYTQDQVESGLGRGSLYFLEHCCLGRLIFGSPVEGMKEDLGGPSPLKLAQRSVKYKMADQRKVDLFAKTAENLIKKGEYAMATFNLHQAFELSFRSVEQMCIGLARISHSIIGHINYCSPFFPTLHPFAQKPKPQGQELLMLLEYSYSGARYGEGFEITREQALEIQGELKQFVKEIESLYARHYANCMLQIEGSNPGPKAKDPECLGQGRGTTKDPQLEKIKELRAEHFETLEQQGRQKDRYYLPLRTKGYLDTSQRASDLIKVCIMALESHWNPDSRIGDPGHSIAQVLGLALELMPQGEMEFLDRINGMLTEAMPSQ